MSTEFAQKLQTYAELIVKVGVNVQPGQRLVLGNLMNFGVNIQTAPLVREVAKAAYKAGAPFVNVLWGNEQLLSVDELLIASSWKGIRLNSHPLPRTDRHGGVRVRAYRASASLLVV